MDITNNDIMHMYKTMERIRNFEEDVVKLFAQGKLAGFVHCYIGKESVATSVCQNLNKNDVITSTHRGHGHLIAKGV